MAYDIDALPGIIELGNLNELGVSTIEFDVTEWLADYPLGVLNITYIRPGETTVYPVNVTGVSIAAPTSGSLVLTLADGVYTLTWTVSDAVTAIAGSGSIVVELAEGGTIKKRSDKVQSYTADGHAAAGDPPEPLADYIEKWSAVDVAVSGLAEGAEPTGAVSQDATGTHFVLGIPDGATGATGATGKSAYQHAVEGGYLGDEATFEADLAAVKGLAAELAAI